MTLLELAHEAIVFCRLRLPHGSDNKRYGQMGQPIPQKKIEKHSKQAWEDTYDRIARIRNPPLVGSYTRASFRARGYKVMLHGAGNCIEQCALSYVYIHGKLWGHDVPFDVVRYVYPGDHIFIVMGQRSRGGRYPRLFSRWSDHAVICDPWAKLECKPGDLVRLWREKMRKWDARRMTLGGARATDPQWLHLPERYDKESIFTGDPL